jgi:hypothetical protein
MSLAMADIGIFHVHLVYFKAIWCNLWPFGIFLSFGMLHQ